VPSKKRGKGERKRRKDVLGKEKTSDMLLGRKREWENHNERKKGKNEHAAGEWEKKKVKGKRMPGRLRNFN